MIRYNLKDHVHSTQNFISTDSAVGFERCTAAVHDAGPEFNSQMSSTSESPSLASHALHGIIPLGAQALELWLNGAPR